MQDIHDYSMTGDGGGGGGGGRFYGGDRRMRTHHQNNILNHHHHQSLKCPRCNSLNTKFCYYNNYNLSQPRHFCKNCRRYWTKGGVLRNVPVGGGCRKVKRSKSKHPSSSSPSPSSTADKPEVEEKSSSSESSSLTASNSVAGTAVKVPPSSGFMATDLTNGIEWSTFLGQSSSDGGVFLETGLETTPFVFGGSFVNQECIDDQLKLEGDQRAQIDPNMGYEPLDWGSGGGGDQTLFDLTSTVDHAYWSQSQWTSCDQDQNGLYLP